MPLDRVLIGLITGFSPTSQLGCIPGLIVAKMGPDCRKAQEHPSPLQLPGGALHLRPLWIPLANAVPVSCTMLGQKGRCRLTPQSGCVPQLVVTRMGQACRKAREHPSVLTPPGGAPHMNFIVTPAVNQHTRAAPLDRLLRSPPSGSGSPSPVDCPWLVPLTARAVSRITCHAFVATAAPITDPSRPLP